MRLRDCPEVFPAEVARGSDGFVALLTGIAVDPTAGRLTLRLELADNDASKRALHAYDVAVARWASRREEVELPEEPATWLVGLAISVRDDVGTTYAPSGAQAGGSGSERLAEIHWRPAPPYQARRLQIAVRDGAQIALTRTDRPSPDGRRSADT